jgi:hypothetical protein
MAAGPSSLPPPPGTGPDSAPSAPTSPTAASPAPPTPSPETQQGTQIAISVVSNLRAIATAYPSAAPFVAQINDLMRQVMAAMMESAKPGEPSAPPQGG